MPVTRGVVGTYVRWATINSENLLYYAESTRPQFFLSFLNLRLPFSARQGLAHSRH